MKHVLTLLAVGLMGVLPAKAQTAADLNEGLQVTQNATTGVFTLSWWGQTGRTYFIQQSFDLMTWQYVPVVLSGAAEGTGMNFSCSDSRQFWKLRYTDDPTYGLSAADADFDYDGLSNQAELDAVLDPFNADTDGDGLPDGWEVANNFNAKSAVGMNGAQGDPDGDGLTNVEEYNCATNPRAADTDADTLSDYAEVYVYFTNPSLADSDIDGLSDAAEVLIYLTAPLNWDTDGDSLSDGAEVSTHLTNPLSKDSDNDGLNDDAEINTHQTNPNAADSDNDGITDKSEIKQGTDANNASSRPAFESVEVVGDGAAGVRKTKQLTITLPQGERSYMVVIAAHSDEYPTFTGTASEFDDVVDWKITPAGGTVIQGEKHVNELHGDWEQSETDGTSYLGLSPVAIVKIETIQGKASGTTSVQVELGAMNVSDSQLPSTLAACVVPVEIQLETTGTVVTKPENDAYDFIMLGTGSIDRLGEIMPLGDGRSNAVDRAYTFASMAVCKVPDLPAVSWRWKRLKSRRSWGIRRNQTNTGWIVSLDNKDGSPPPPVNDTSVPADRDESPSETTSNIYYFDNSAMLPADVALIGIGDYVYEEKQFTYQVEMNHSGNWIKVAELNAAQRILVRRTAQLGTAMAKGAFQGIYNTYSTTIKVDSQINLQEVWSIVLDNDPVVFDADVNN